MNINMPSWKTREAEILVDWQNCVSQSEYHTDEDAQRAVRQVSDIVNEAVAHLNRRSIKSVHVRLYGSWDQTQFVDSRNTYVRAIESAVSLLPRRVSGVTVIYELVRQLAHMGDVPNSIAFSAYVIQRPCRSFSCSRRVGEQKLADTMIVADSSYFGAFPNIAVVVVSDDQDMLPGLLSASYFRRTCGATPSEEIFWLRPSRPRGPNDIKYSSHFTILGSE